MHPFCSHNQQRHTKNKVQYPANADVIRVTWFQKMLAQVPKYLSPMPHSDIEHARPFQMLLCIYHSQDCLPTPSLNRRPLKGQWPVSSPITILSWFLLKLNNSPVLFAQVLLRKPLSCLCPWVNYQCSSSFLLVQSMITHMAIFADMPKAGSGLVCRHEESCLMF